MPVDVVIVIDHLILGTSITRRCCDRFVWNASLTSVPHEISGCKSLITLDLTDNRISEPLPTGLASLANVNTAYFDGNPRLPCPIPPAVQSWLRGVSYHVDPCP